MRNWPVLIAVLAVLLLFAACPKGQQDTGADGDMGASSSADTGTQTADADQPTGATPAEGEPNAGETSTGAADATGGEATADASVLEGEWLALFGRQDEGVLEDTWQQDQRIRFDKQGQVVFTLSLGGKPVEVKGAYTAGKRGEVLLTLPAAQAVDSGLSHLAPLGIGRNEEVGLLKQAGRNEEIGLVGGEAPDAKGNVSRNVAFAIHGNFLVLKDKHSHLMVYSRYGAEAPAAADLSGGWTAGLYGQNDIAATVKSDGKAVSIDFGAQGQFNGELVKGVAVGKIKRTVGMSLAALWPETDGSLRGVYLPEPYLELKTDLALTR